MDMPKEGNFTVYLARRLAYLAYLARRRLAYLAYLARRRLAYFVLHISALYY